MKHFEINKKEFAYNYLNPTLMKLILLYSHFLNHSIS